MEILIVGGGYVGMYTARRLERLLRRGEATVTVVDPHGHAYVGSVAGLGHHQGVAQVYQIRLTGFAGWLAHRIYHLFWVPTLSHKARVLADWTLALFFRRETAQLTSLEHPADDFRDAFRAA
jgi:NADH dehydrogenase FAD-containing subunit